MNQDQVNALRPGWRLKAQLLYLTSNRIYWYNIFAHNPENDL